MSYDLTGYTYPNKSEHPDHLACGRAKVVGPDRRFTDCWYVECICGKSQIGGIPGRYIEERRYEL